MRHDPKPNWLLPVFVFVPAVVVSPHGSETQSAGALDYSYILSTLRAQLPKDMANASVPGIAVAQMHGPSLVWRNIAWNPLASD